MEIKVDEQVNNYANSMFRFESLNDKWLNSCADYLTFLFGDSLKGKTVVDYAFGRGNWAVAFIKAGAKAVIAIDASIDNVSRFETYCKTNNLASISVIHGNVLNQKIDIKADLVWIYGILHHIKETDIFLNSCKLFMKDEKSLLYVYYYNKNSLRNLTVDLCRSLHVYTNEEEFINDNYLFLRSSKNRASDDLVAPHINWYTALELKETLNKNGLFVIKQDIDFYEFNNKKSNEEFYPIQFLCSLDKSKEIVIKDKAELYKKEMETLFLLANDIFSTFKNKEERKKIAIGLFNTHFSYLQEGHLIIESIIEIYLYIMRILIQLKAFQKMNFSELTEKHYDLICKALMDAERTKEAESIGKNLFTDYLLKNRIRL